MRINDRDKKVLTVMHRIEKHLTQSLTTFNRLVTQSNALNLQAVDTKDLSANEIFTLKENFWQLIMRAQCKESWINLLPERHLVKALFIPIEIIINFDKYFYGTDTKVIAKHMLKLHAAIQARENLTLSVDELLHGIWDAHVLFQHGLACGYVREVPFDNNFLLIIENYVLPQKPMQQLGSAATFFKTANATCVLPTVAHTTQLTSLKHP